MLHVRGKRPSECVCQREAGGLFGTIHRLLDTYVDDLDFLNKNCMASRLSGNVAVMFCYVGDIGRRW